MISATISIPSSLRKILTPDDIRKIEGTAAMVAAREITRRIRENRITPPSRKEGVTLIDTGRLVRNIRAVNNEVISDLTYSAIHHYGGVVTPKVAKMLTIPLNFAAKRRRAREFRDLFIAKGILFRKEGNKIKPMFKLVPRVTIPARKYFDITGDIEQKVLNSVQYYINQKLGG